MYRTHWYLNKKKMQKPSEAMAINAIVYKNTILRSDVTGVNKSETPF